MLNVNTRIIIIFLRFYTQYLIPNSSIAMCHGGYLLNDNVFNKKYNIYFLKIFVNKMRALFDIIIII